MFQSIHGSLIITQDITFLMQPVLNKPHSHSRDETTFHGGKAGHVKGTCKLAREIHIGMTVVIPTEESLIRKFLKYL